jgi:hypothetical protein
MSRGTSALYGRGGTAAEEGAQSTHTVLTLEVENITDEVRDLEGRGVGFLDFGAPEIKTVDHVFLMGDEKPAYATVASDARRFGHMQLGGLPSSLGLTCNGSSELTIPTAARS